MVVPVVSQGRRDCGCADCPDPGDCPDGQECLPSSFIDPDDCPPGGGGPIADPSEVDGLLLWYDANDGATFTLDGDDRVDALADKSGNGFDLANTTGGAGPGPLYDGASTLNGLPVIFFDGSQRLESTSDVVDAQPLTTFIVFRMNGPAPTLFFPGIYAFGNSSGPSLFRRDDNQKLYLDAGGSPSYPTNTFDVSDRATHIVTTVFDDAGPSSIARMDGVEEFSGISLGGTDASGHFYLGNNVSNRGFGGVDGGAYLAEFVAYDRALTADEILGVEDYLRRKWQSEPATDCSYRPYCLSTNHDDPATVIVGLGPWSYYPMDDASGLIQDASGNNRDATSSAGGTITYAQPGITSKRTKSIEFEGGRFVIPKPFSLDSGNAWSVIWLEEIETFHGSGSPAQGSVMFGETVGGTACLTICNTGSGDLYQIWGAAGGQNFASYVQDSDLVGRPAVICLVASPASQPRLYVDGVRWGAAQNPGLIGPADLCVGSSDDGFWGYPKHRMSDLAFFDRGLSDAEIISITEALMDAAGFSSSMVKP